LDGYKKAPASPGAYIIRSNRPIQRLKGADKHGILTIGESNNLRRRLASFVRCISNEYATGHMAAWRFRAIGMDKMFPADSLWVSWCQTEDKAAAYRKEGEMLDFYQRLHFELPPLNYKFNWPEVVGG